MGLVVASSLEFNLVEEGENCSQLSVETIISMFSLAFFFVCVSDLQAFQSFEHYSISEKAMDYRILHMDEDQDRMYVGCKDHVLSMDINNITHDTLKVSRCFLTFPVINVAMLESDFLSLYHEGSNKNKRFNGM